MFEGTADRLNVKDHVKSVLRIRSAQAYIPMVGTRPLECY